MLGINGFQSFWILGLLLLVPIFHRLFVKRAKPATVLFSVPIPKEARAFDPEPWLLVLRYLGLLLLIWALARPQARFSQNERSVNGVDIVMVLDLSASMNIEDLESRPRMDLAKETMERFIRGRSNDRVGFVVFSGEALTLVPPTLDYELVLKSLRDAQIGVLRDGTAIGDGLSVAVSRLKDSTAKSRVIVLLTDGDNNIGQVDPATAGDLAAGFGIRVYTIAIGREGRVKLPIRQKTITGQEIVTYQWFENALNPELLKQIAAQTNGKFYRVTEAEALPKVFSEINQLEKTEIKSNEKVRFEDRFYIPLLLGLFLLVFEQLLRLTVWRVFT